MVEKASLMKILLCLLVAFAALTANCQDVAGHYVLRGVMEVGSEMLLKPDGTFEFMLAYGAADYWSKGTWRRDGNAVILQSSGKKEEPFKLQRSEAGKAGQIRVWVIGQDGKGVENIDVYLLADGKPLNLRTDDKGVAAFPDVPKAHAVAFEIQVYDVATKPFAIDADHKDYYFALNGDAVTEMRFDGDRLAIDGSALVLTKQGESMRYVKESE